jgi:Ca-activated chloride channel homolog
MKTSAAAIVATLALFLALNAQDSSTVARPRPRPGATSTDDDSIPSKLSPKATKDNDAGADANFKAEANIVSLDVAVLDNKGVPIPDLTRDNFRILEDNVPQKIKQFSIGDAPLTVAMVIEFSARFQAYYTMGWAQTLNAAYGFASTLNHDDYLALVTYDLRTHIICDFTDDRARTQQALSQLRFPTFQESNMFDALADTADRMSNIDGRKAILLIASGIDTFSKLTYDKTRVKLQEAGVPVYPIEMLQVQRMMSASGGVGGIGNMDFLQGDNELRTFAKETGGQAYFPQYIQELPGVFQNITKSLRSEYSLGYTSSNRARDGKFRKTTVQLVNPATNEPLKVIENGKTIKYSIVTQAGYTASRSVE